MPATSAAPWLDLALAEVGTKEAPGAADNPLVLAYYRDAGQPQAHDAVAWCAAFVGAMLARARYPLPPHDTALLARSYLTYGIACAPQPGAIGVWPRGAAWQGHVGFVVDVDAARGTVRRVSGNLGDQVAVDEARIDEALAFRWPVAATVPALRQAGSTEVRMADRLELAGVGGAAVAVGGAAAADALQGTAAPTAPVINPDALTWIDKAVASAKAVAGLIAEHPWLGGVVLAAVAMLWLARRLKARRVARHAAGAPLSVEVLP
jgi:uncharacterized protein (TIGR02594 family)